MANLKETGYEVTGVTTPRVRILTLLAALAIAGTVPGIQAAAAQTPSEQHCVVEVVGQQPDGEFITTPAVCYPSFDQVLNYIATRTASTSLRSSALIAAVTPEGRVSTSGTFILGTHYEYRNYGGSSFSVVGVDCAGGYLNLNNTAWNNRVSSTRNGCPIIRHWSEPYLQGNSSDLQWPGGNLPSSMDNQTSSIQYLG